MKFEQAVVVVPAHNEIDNLPRSLSALLATSMSAQMPVLIVVVLDSCDDGSDRLIGRYGPNVHFISTDAANVGAAQTQRPNALSSSWDRVQKPHMKLLNI